MNKIRLFLFSVLTVFAVNSFADIKSDLKDLVIANNAALKNADINAFQATMTPNPVIVDGFFPFIWRGKDASANYLKVIKELFAKYQPTEFVIKVNDPVTFDKVKTKVYAVYPGEVTFKDKESKMHVEQGLQTITFTLTKDGKWLINGQIWASTKSEVN